MIVMPMKKKRNAPLLSPSRTSFVKDPVDGCLI